jgi:CIC family chloride channel protein
VMENSFFRFVGYREWVIIVFVAVVCLLKAFATSITIQSGGNGGNFAPSLFAGGSLGYVFALLCIQAGINDVPMVNLVLVGMAGVMSGVLYAPLTAIFLIAESSSGYDLFIPLMIVSVISFLMAKWFSAVSPDLEKMASEGKIFTKEHDRNLLSLLRTLDLLDKDVQVISDKASFDELREVVKNGKRNLVAVLNEHLTLVGIITLDDLRPILFSRDLDGSLNIVDLLKEPAAVIIENDSVVEVARKFDETGLWHLPVVTATGKFAGFISKSSVLNSYRQLLQAHSG